MIYIAHLSMFKWDLQTSTELTVERLRLSVTVAHKYFHKFNDTLSRRDRPSNIGITTLRYICIGSFKSPDRGGFGDWVYGLKSLSEKNKFYIMKIRTLPEWIHSSKDYSPKWIYSDKGLLQFAICFYRNTDATSNLWHYLLHDLPRVGNDNLQPLF
mgnify:CR=1 FL=1